MNVYLFIMIMICISSLSNADTTCWSNGWGCHDSGCWNIYEGTCSGFRDACGNHYCNCVPNIRRKRGITNSQNLNNTSLCIVSAEGYVQIFQFFKT